MELVLLIGIPAAGKSTFYRRHLAGTHFRVNLDTLKKRPRELSVVQGCIAERRAFAVDNTNVLAYDRARYILLAKAAGYRVKGYVFDVPVEDAIVRNMHRTGAAYVPTHVIRSFHAKCEPPTWDEGFDELHRVTIVDGEFVVKRMRRTKLARHKYHYHFLQCAKGGEKIDFWIDAGANGLFGLHRPADPSYAPGCNPHGQYSGVVNNLSACVFDYDTWQLLLDLHVLRNVYDTLPEKTAPNVPRSAGHDPFHTAGAGFLVGGDPCLADGARIGRQNPQRRAVA